jgi:hypothetical protein
VRTFRSAVLSSSFFVLSSAAAAVGCGPTPLSDAQPSAEALARVVMAAVERRDEAALRRLAISEDEFRDRVWPSLPAARPERNMPMSYVWGDLRQKSDGGLRSVLAEHGGQRYTFEKIRFAGETTDYAAFRVHREAVFVVRRGSDGPIELRLCGSMLESDGAWKIFSFVVDD